jgi:predicted nucleotidyltransferase
MTTTSDGATCFAIAPSRAIISGVKTQQQNVDQVLGELSGALRTRYGERYVGLWLYGSQARGEAHADSDIDVILVLRETSSPTREIDRIADILADINVRHGALVSVLPVDARKLDTADGPFWRNVRRERIAA